MPRIGVPEGESPKARPHDLLVADRAETEDRLARLRDDFTGVVDATRDANSDDEHDPEGQTIAYERSQTGALIRQAELHLAEIEAALTRVEHRTYGVCESCGAAVPAGRLDARPTARTCIDCAQVPGNAGLSVVPPSVDPEAPTYRIPEETP